MFCVVSAAVQLVPVVSSKRIFLLISLISHRTSQDMPDAPPESEPAKPVTNRRAEALRGSDGRQRAQKQQLSQEAQFEQDKQAFERERLQRRKKSEPQTNGDAGDEHEQAADKASELPAKPKPEIITVDMLKDITKMAAAAAPAVTVVPQKDAPVEAANAAPAVSATVSEAQTQLEGKGTAAAAAAAATEPEQSKPWSIDDYFSSLFKSDSGDGLGSFGAFASTSSGSRVVNDSAAAGSEASLQESNRKLDGSQHTTVTSPSMAASGLFSFVPPGATDSTIDRYREFTASSGKDGQSAGAGLGQTGLWGTGLGLTPAPQQHSSESAKHNAQQQQQQQPPQQQQHHHHAQTSSNSFGVASAQAQAQTQQLKSLLMGSEGGALGGVSASDAAAREYRHQQQQQQQQHHQQRSSYGTPSSEPAVSRELLDRILASSAATQHAQPSLQVQQAQQAQREQLIREQMMQEQYQKLLQQQQAQQMAARMGSPPQHILSHGGLHASHNLRGNPLGSPTATPPPPPQTVSQHMHQMQLAHQQKLLAAQQSRLAAAAEAAKMASPLHSAQSQPAHFLTQYAAQQQRQLQQAAQQQQQLALLAAQRQQQAQQARLYQQQLQAQQAVSQRHQQARLQMQQLQQQREQQAIIQQQMRSASEVDLLAGEHILALVGLCVGMFGMTLTSGFPVMLSCVQWFLKCRARPQDCAMCALHVPFFTALGINQQPSMGHFPPATSASQPFSFHSSSSVSKPRGTTSNFNMDTSAAAYRQLPQVGLPQSSAGMIPARVMMRGGSGVPASSAADSAMLMEMLRISRPPDL